MVTWRPLVVVGGGDVVIGFIIRVVLSGLLAMLYAQWKVCNVKQMIEYFVSPKKALFDFVSATSLLKV
mgnify:CR=1 FL=1